MKVDILTPIRFGGPQKWGDDLVRALKNEGIEARNIHNLFGIIQRFFYTDADVIHTTVPLFFNFQNKPIILTIKGDFYRENNIWKFLYPIAIRRAKKITVPSNFLKNELGLKDAIIIPNGIFPEDFKPIKHKKKKILQIVTVTGFSFWEKARGVIELLKILEEVKKKTKQKFNFVVVGSGSFLEKIKEEAKKYDVPVKFTGFHPNPKEILEKSDIFVYYSFFDNTPNTILEAMACGLPIIYNDIGGVREMFDKKRQSSIIDNSRDYVDFLLKLVNVSKNREITGLHNRKSVIERLSYEKIIKKYLSLFDY